MKQAVIYSLKVWLTGVIVSTILVVALTKTLLRSVYYFDNLENIFGFWGMTTYLACILSIPSLLLFGLCSWQVIKYNAIAPYRKSLLSLVGILLTVTPFYIFFHNEESVRVVELMTWILSYSLVIKAAILFYKLKPLTSTTT